METTANIDRFPQRAVNDVTSRRNYLPTVKQIREECRNIRRDWSADVRIRRARSSRRRLIELWQSTN